MKKVFLVLALVSTVLVSCKKVEAPASLTKVDSTTVQVDSASVDTTVVDTTAVK
jgi:hypothetical protein